jgi:hypothetical protein
MSLRFGAFCLLAALLAAPAAAQPPAPAGATQPAPDITVTGNRDLSRQARSFVDALTRRMHSGQLASFQDYVCPAAYGIRPAMSDILVRRIRRVAAAAGMRVAPQNCSANVLLILVPDKRAALTQLRRESPGMFGDLSEWRISAMASSDDPAAAWLLTQTRSANGQDMGRHGESLGQDIADAQDRHAVGWRLASNVRVVVGAAVVVIQASAVVGMTPTQIADYAAMRSFTDADVAAASAQAQPTILTLFERNRAAEAPLSVTQWDLSFLRALSASRSDVPGNLQRNDVAHAFRQDLDRAARAQPDH